jgi:hypothetical protein
MNVDLIKNKLNELSAPKGGNSNKKDEKSLNFWKPSVGKQLVRFVPSKNNPDNPFTELYFHYGIGKRTIISPLNFGEKDPIVEFAKELRKTKEPENWKTAKKLEPKMRVFAPVIVRGEEEKGVRLWEFGKEVYQSLLSLAADEEVGDFTDILQGRDIKVETTGPDTNGTTYNKSKVLPALKTSTLSDDQDEAEKWLKNQPDAIQFYKKYTFDEIKGFLVEWLNPEEETEEISESPSITPPNTSTSTPKAAFATPKKENFSEDEFDDLFEDEN